jgi:predicted transcriptional regulator
MSRCFCKRLHRRLDRIAADGIASSVAAVTGKHKATVRFQAANGNNIAAVFGVCVVRR